MTALSALSRRDFLATTKATVGAVALFGTFPSVGRGAEDPTPSSAAGSPATAIPPEFPAQDREAVEEVVGAAHTRFDRVKELVTARPALAKASWDWGFGDWESALGAASHMGRGDIAELLIEHGARPNLFTFAMLGELEVVKQFVEAMPGVQRVPGPHGITLLQHVRMVKRQDRNSGSHRKKARAVEQYLETLGGADIVAKNLDVSDAEKKSYVGRYSFGAGPDNTFEVLQNRRGMLAIRRGERVSRTLRCVEQHAFAPYGAPAVRIRFDMAADRAISLTIHDPIPLVKATRSG